MKPTVLIADDDPQLLAMLEEVLSKDFTVITARSGASALTQFGRNAVDIVLTDLAMPSFNGLQVAAKCKAAKPSVPILMLTAWDVLLSDEDLADAGEVLVAQQDVPRGPRQRRRGPRRSTGRGPRRRWRRRRPGQ